MHERVNILAIQAGFEYDLGDCNFYQSDSAQHINIQLKNFAELIVKECIDCARGAELADDVALRNKLGFNDGISEAVIHIKKHFGVK